jgi:hypothetical protein
LIIKTKFALSKAEQIIDFANPGLKKKDSIKARQDGIFFYK